MPDTGASLGDLGFTAARNYVIAMHKPIHDASPADEGDARHINQGWTTTVEGVLGVLQKGRSRVTLSRMFEVEYLYPL